MQIMNQLHSSTTGIKYNVNKKKWYIACDYLSSNVLSLCGFRFQNLSNWCCRNNEALINSTGYHLTRLLPVIRKGVPTSLSAID